MQSTRFNKPPQAAFKLSISIKEDLPNVQAFKVVFIRTAGWKISIWIGITCFLNLIPKNQYIHLFSCSFSTKRINSSEEFLIFCISYIFNYTFLSNGNGISFKKTHLWTFLFLCISMLSLIYFICKEQKYTCPYVRSKIKIHVNIKGKDSRITSFTHYPFLHRNKNFLRRFMIGNVDIFFPSNFSVFIRVCCNAKSP